MNGDRLVVDASILAKAYLKDEVHSEIAQAILGDYAGGAVELFAPQVLLYEIPSAIQGAVRRRRLSGDEARRAIADFFELGIPTVGDSGTLEAMVTSAYAASEEYGCRLYDALYLIVAEGLRIPFVTADRRLFDAVKGRMQNVIWIEDYAQGSSTS